LVANRSQDHLGFRVAYDGEFFSGFQSQKNHRSVQAELESALRTVLNFQGRIHYSSRTDAGVHALDQLIVLPHFFSGWQLLPESKQKRLRISLNAILNGQASVWQALRMKSDFNIKAHIKWKEYQYFVIEGRSIVPHWQKNFWSIRSTMDLGLIRKNLKLLEGEQDFRSFSNRQRTIREMSSTVRHMMKSDLEILEHPFGSDHRILKFTFRANGFLYHMIRNIMGTLVEIGLGKRGSLRSLLIHRETIPTAVLAPPHALTLTKTFIEKKWYEVIDGF
jgi:tRNA pseudouridine38-40 synthase